MDAAQFSSQVPGNQGQQRLSTSGKFKRTRATWTPESWDDGYVDNKGRFRVYRPDYPNAYSLGYALRAHVVWWLRFGECHPAGTNLHHKNECKLDDRIDNLELLEHGEHSRQHNTILGAQRSCEICGKRMLVKHWRLRIGKGRFCSMECFRKYQRGRKHTDEHRAKISAGLKRAHELVVKQRGDRQC